MKRQCCGRCKNRLIEVEVPPTGTTTTTVGGGGGSSFTPKKKTARPLSGYNLFVKENSKSVRDKLQQQQQRQLLQQQGTMKENNNNNHHQKVTQAQVLKECARLWREKDKS